MNENNVSNINKEQIYKLVKEKVKIEDVISSYGYTLKKSGNNFVTLCPFHNDTKPSLSIQTTEQYFKCFTCGAKGTAIEFIVQMEQKTNPKFSFADAVIKLKNDFGLPVNIQNLEKQVEEQKYIVNGKKYTNEKIQAINMLEDISEKYGIYLTNTKQGQKHLEYLYKRGLTDETIKRFQLGFAPREATAKYFQNVNDNLKNSLLVTGMINKTNNNFIELFTDRITFPIKDSKGNTVGFTARTLDPRENAKYLNSKESDVFKKSELFFNWDKCINEAYKENSIVILEGNMDVISSDSLGLKNVCGLNGVALSNTQINMLKQTKLPVILALDNDKAGHDATLKLADVLENNGIKTSVIDIGKYGNFKDNGDILMASLKEPALKNDFSNKFLSLEQSVFSFKLKYDLFQDKEITPSIIKNVYSKIEHEIDSYKKVEFIDYCQKNSSYSKKDIEDIISSRNLNENPYAKLGLSLIKPIIDNIKTTNEIKEKLVLDISNNTDKYFKIEGLSFQLNKEKVIDFIKENQKSNNHINNTNIKDNNSLKNNNQNVYNKSQNYYSSNQTEQLKHNKVIDVFSIEGLKQIRREIKMPDQIRTTGEVGYVKPDKIEKNFNNMCKQYSNIDYKSMTLMERKAELLKAYNNIISLKIFEGSNGKIELEFIKKAADKFGLTLDFSKTNIGALNQMYQKASKNKEYGLAKNILFNISSEKKIEREPSNYYSSLNNVKTNSMNQSKKNNIEEKDMEER